VTDAPLLPAPLYGLRTWRVAADEHGEALSASCKDTRWPDGGAWLEATCDAPGRHAAPHADCACGIYAWHPSRASARRVLASRFELPGIVEAIGAIELQDDGFRAQRARPFALVVTPGRNAARARRLARRYAAQVAEVDDADGLLAWCEQRGLGLDPPTVEQLLGPGYAARRALEQRRVRRRNLVRVGAVAAIGTAVLALGAAFASGPSSPHGVYGRTGWVVCPQPSEADRAAGLPAPVPPNC
jgi:hypothetical protein